MRFIVSPQFAAKLGALSRTDLERVKSFLQTIQTSDKAHLLQGSIHQIKALEQDIYVARSGQTRFYFSFGTSDEGEYVLLLDTTTEETRGASQALFATKDPRLSHALNPTLNNVINPVFNTRLNPVFNTSINPTFNTRLNPTFNTSINPVFNTRLNPVFNTSINPSFNSRLNPLFNSAINPQLNRAFGGPYLYALNLSQEGYLVRANDDVDLVFDLTGGHIGELVVAGDGVQIQFDVKNTWNGYVIRANEDVRLRYDLNNQWIGQIV